jgi:starch phosphorylase
MVQGVDVWLNNPRRPLEASGTSGMKASCNGGLNLSVLDGWWVEGYHQDNGWAIGAGEEYTDLHYQDDVESRAIYDLLEQELVPLFYTRSSDGIPRGWMRATKRSISTVSPVFNTNRMVQEYVEQCYWPSAERFRKLSSDNLQNAVEYVEQCYWPSAERFRMLSSNDLQNAVKLSQWRRVLTKSWPQVRVESVEANENDPLRVGTDMRVKARVNLGSFSPDDVQVQLFHGVVDSLGEIPHPETVRMSHNGVHEGNSWVYHGTIPCRSSGQHGFAVRVLPRHPSLDNPFEPGLVCWG